MSVTRVVVESDPEYDDHAPIQITPGESVVVGDEPGEDFPAFVFVTTANGSGWVPERYLDGARPAATVLHPYDTRVLMPRVGEHVEVLRDDVESGWSWCRDARGAEGWVMNRALGPVDIAEPVRRQLAAYNDRDIETFVACFAEDCAVEDGAGALLMQGRAALRESYGRMFDASPELHARVVSRIVLEEYVLDEERVTDRMGSTAESHVVAVYRVESGLITHVRFLR